MFVASQASVSVGRTNQLLEMCFRSMASVQLQTKRRQKLHELSETVLIWN